MSRYGYILFFFLSSHVSREPKFLCVFFAFTLLRSPEQHSSSTALTRMDFGVWSYSWFVVPVSSTRFPPKSRCTVHEVVFVEGVDCTDWNVRVFGGSATNSIINCLFVFDAALTSSNSPQYVDSNTEQENSDIFPLLICGVSIIYSCDQTSSGTYPVIYLTVDTSGMW